MDTPETPSEEIALKTVPPQSLSLKTIFHHNFFSMDELYLKLSRYAEDPAKYINPYIITTPAKEFPSISHTSPLDDFTLEWNEPLQLTSDFFTYDYCDTDNLLRPVEAKPEVQTKYTVNQSSVSLPKLSKKVEKKKKKSPLQSQMHTCTGDVCVECNRGSDISSGSYKIPSNIANSTHSVSKKKKKRGF